MSMHGNRRKTRRQLERRARMNAFHEHFFGPSTHTPLPPGDKEDGNETKTGLGRVAVSLVVDDAAGGVAVDVVEVVDGDVDVDRDGVVGKWIVSARRGNRKGVLHGRCDAKRCGKRERGLLRICLLKVLFAPGQKARILRINLSYHGPDKSIVPPISGLFGQQLANGGKL